MRIRKLVYYYNQWKNTHYDSPIFWIRTGAIGIWCIVVLMIVQAFHYEDGASPVYVTGGNVGVDGSVEVCGSVDIDNTVDVNLDEVLGRPVGCRTSYTIDGREYQSIDVSNRGW